MPGVAFHDPLPASPAAGPDRTTPPARPAAITGAPLSCLITTGHAWPPGDLLGQATAAFRPA